MKIYNEYITLQTAEKREFVDLTPQIKAAVEKCGFRDGIVLVSSMHSNASVIVSDNEPGFLEDLRDWLEEAAPREREYKHGHKFESSAAIHLQGLLLHHQAVVGLTEGRLDLGPWQVVLFTELDGQRPKRILVKLLGE